MTAILIIAFAYAFYNNIRLYYYLKNNNYDRWRNITTIEGFGPGSSNPFRWFKYLFSNDDNNDINVVKYKDGVLVGLKYSLFFFAGMIVNLVLLVLSINKG